MAWDVITMMDGAHRLEAGQMPHVDYLSPVGMFPIGMVYLGMKIGGPLANAPAFGSALGFIVLSLLAWFVSARRFPPLFAFALSLLTGGLFVATRPLAFGMLSYLLEFSHASYAMWYNRVGWALLVVLAVQVLLPPKWKEGAALGDLIESFLAGCLVSLLALTKVNYLAAAVGISLVGFCVAPPGRRRMVGYAAGIACLPVLLMVFTHFSFRSWFGDMVTLGRLADAHDRSVRLVELGLVNLPDMVLVGAVVWLLRPFFGASKAFWRRGGIVRLWILCGTCAGIGLVVLTLNAQNREVPLFAVACAIALEMARREWGNGSADALAPGVLRLRFAVGAGIFLFLMAGTFANDAASVAYSWAFKNHMRYATPESGIIQSPSLGPLLMPPRPHEQVEKDLAVRDLLARRDFSPYIAMRDGITPYQYAHLVNDGLALLKPYVTPSMRVFCMDSTNPFPIALCLPSPKGGAIWWDAKTFSQKLFPNPEQVFGEVTHVMVPKVAVNRNTAAGMREIYGDYLAEHFTPLCESALWNLYASKKPIPQAK